MQPSEYPKMDSLCNEILTAIEQDEIKVLGWGFVEVRSPLTETLPDIVEVLSGVGKQLWEEAQQWDVRPEHILENLTTRKLIFKSEQFYRSRFAETIRLLSLLRQRFSPYDWQTAGRLVSDYKIDLRRRNYPKRDISSQELLEELSQQRASPLYLAAVERLLQGELGNTLSIAKFQKDAILHHYRILHGGASEPLYEHALVIGADTGAGKTKAFYVPAMAEIAASLTRDRFVRALALYPRVELLKDQLVEAIQEARKLNDLLQQHKSRTITIGAYYADTPVRAELFLRSQQTNWKLTPQKDGWESPFFQCPDCRPLSRPLVWYKKDIEQEAEDNKRHIYGKHAILHCPNCQLTIAEQFSLTRDQMIHHPPDILFTTTEMLNRRLSKVDEQDLFGCAVERAKPPSMLLLDEIHTHEGLHGAQVAYLLRRWRYGRRQSKYASTPLLCVGLSATLQNAEAFFAKLTGISRSNVHYIHPTNEDLESEGAEYNIVLKGDPVSGTSLLSTSVQTVMLLARMLDINANEPSHKAYGQKIFAFSDKLDVLNRWYQTEQDAEINQRLSQYRLVQGDTQEIQRKKSQAGQFWWACTSIGHNLKLPLIIDRTSSQDRGVNPKAQLVLATSTLEVGFNDEAVGAVVQHKAPHSLASFVQRKGRAGRRRTMRPWMIVVASAYGRDRWAFQHAENLFSPTLSDIALPVENYYVRKIQATFAFMDWLAFKLKYEPECRRIDMWKVLSGESRGEFFQRPRDLVCQLIAEVLSNPTQRDELAQYLRLALGLYSQREVDALLWDEPRSLLFEVLPTILRQITSNWQSLSDGEAIEWSDGVSKNPLPEFITPNLFSDLRSLDIPLTLPPPPPSRAQSRPGDSTKQEEREEQLPLHQCLVEFAPGNVNKRFAVSKNEKEAYWIPIPVAELHGDVLPIGALNSSIACDKLPEQFLIQGNNYQFYTPRRYYLKQIPDDVKSTSSAQLIWKSHFAGKQLRSSNIDQEEELLDAEIVELTPRSRWNSFLANIRSYTQTNGDGVEVARLATGVHAETRYEGNKRALRQWLKFEDATQKPIGIGYMNYVDALQFQFRPLDVVQCLALATWPELRRNLSPEYFRYRLSRHRVVLTEKLSTFEIDWLWQLELSMLVTRAVEKRSHLQDVAPEIHTSRVERAEATMKTIFQAQQAEEYDEEKVGRLHEHLKQLLENDGIQQALLESERVLWAPDDPEFYEWLNQCYTSSIGTSLFTTLTDLAPDTDPEDLHMDIDGNSIWISEAVPGGIGIITKIVDVMKTRPYKFDLQMQDTLSYCDRQQLDSQLRVVAELVRQGDQEVNEVFAEMRQELVLDDQEKALKRLKRVLEQHGITATRDFVVSLLAKFLRPNSSSDTDTLIAQLVDFWQKEEARLNCTIDLRVIAVASLAIPAIRQQVQNVFQRISSETAPDNSQIFNVLQSLLWLPCTTSCPDCIEEYHPFQQLVKPSRQLLLALMQADERTIVYGQENWLEQLKEELGTTYRARVSCQQEQLADCKKSLLTLLVEPTDIGFQFFYPTIERITRIGTRWTIEMRIREFAHV